MEGKLGSLVQMEVRVLQELVAFLDQQGQVEIQASLDPLVIMDLQVLLVNQERGVQMVLQAQMDLLDN